MFVIQIRSALPPAGVMVAEPHTYVPVGLYPIAGELPERALGVHPVASLLKSPLVRRFAVAWEPVFT